MASTDAPAPLPPGLISNPSETYQVDIIVCAVITWLIGVLFVALRFYTRMCLLHNAVGIEEWLILVSLIFSAATSAGMIEQAVYGLGRHFLDIDPALLMPMQRATWYTILWYMLSLLATKTAILLLLFQRVLTHSFRHARSAVYAVLALVLATNGAWTLYTVLTACIPLQAFWSPFSSITKEDDAATWWCRPQRDWYLNTALHIGTDVLLYLLPLPVLVRLRVGVRQKAALYAVLVLGFVACVVSAVRLWDLTRMAQTADYTYDSVSIPYLTVVGINAAIPCACCMTLRPLVSRWFPGLWGSRSGGEEFGRRDEEMGGQGGRAGGALGDIRSPPTIGSRPLRKAKARRGDLDTSQLMDDTEAVSEGAERNEKRSMAMETDRTSFAETESESGRTLTPREPQPVHLAADKGDDDSP